MPKLAKRKTPKARKKVDPSKFKKLWQLLELGLHDLRKQETTKGCVVSMGTWLEPYEGTCYACLAGSVMKHSLGRTRFHISTHPPAWAAALDYLRLGAVSLASGRIGHWIGDSLDRHIHTYVLDRNLWWQDMRKLLKDLKAADL